METVQLNPDKKIYFASDFHFGIPNAEVSLARERRVCAWLDRIKEDAQHIYLLGDVFDVWFEYKQVVPKGYIRFMGKLAELVDAGISISVFTGNHDLWMNNYFTEQLNIPVYFENKKISIEGKIFYLGHGDGIGPGDKGYKMLKSVMSNKYAQSVYRWIHPDWGMKIAEYFSRKGPKHAAKEPAFLGEDKEWQILFAKDYIKQQHVDYFIFGHRHIVLEHKIDSQTLLFNLGDWIQYDTYAVFDGTSVEIQYFKS